MINSAGMKDDSCRFFRILTRATFLFMYGMNTNGFCPLKFFTVPVVKTKSQKPLNVKISSTSNLRNEVRAGLIGDYNKKDCCFLCKENFFFIVIMPAEAHP